MKNLDNSNYTAARIKKIAYIVICCLMREVITSGTRIALYGELKGLKKIVNPSGGDLDADTALLRILDEPHVKLASVLTEYIRFEVLEPYALVNLLDDEEVLEDEWATETGYGLFWRFMFYRKHPRRRDRYINFGKVMHCAERVIYELLKLMVTGETRAFDRTYRTNYSAGRLKALMSGNEDRNALMVAGLIENLKAYKIEIDALTQKDIFFKKKASAPGLI